MKAGDLIVCLDAENCRDITYGKTYKVEDGPFGNHIDGVAIKNDNGKIREYYKSRFRLLQEIREDKLKELGI